jgi:hypothetical protein
MYGARLMHATPDDRVKEQFAEFIEQHGPKRAVAIFNNCLMDVFGTAARLYRVIGRDFEQWQSVDSLIGPDRQRIDTLFETFERMPPSVDRA